MLLKYGSPGFFLTLFESIIVLYCLTCFRRILFSSIESCLQFRVWARTDAFEDAAYALEFGPKVVRFLEEYLDLPYPLPKLGKWKSVAVIWHIAKDVSKMSKLLSLLPEPHWNKNEKCVEMILVLAILEICVFDHWKVWDTYIILK